MRCHLAGLQVQHINGQICTSCCRVSEIVMSSRVAKVPSSRTRPATRNLHPDAASCANCRHCLPTFKQLPVGASLHISRICHSVCNMICARTAIRWRVCSVVHHMPCTWDQSERQGICMRIHPNHESSPIEHFVSRHMSDPVQ